MHLQMMLGQDNIDEDCLSSARCPCWKIAVMDAIVLVPKMSKKQSRIMNAKDISQYFNEQLMHLTGRFNKVKSYECRRYQSIL